MKKSNNERLVPQMIYETVRSSRHVGVLVDIDPSRFCTNHERIARALESDRGIAPCARRRRARHDHVSRSGRWRTCGRRNHRPCTPGSTVFTSTSLAIAAPRMRARPVDISIPSNQPHGAPDSRERHEGDMGNVEADSSGVAKVNYLDHVLSFVGAKSLIGRAVIVHAKADDLKSQPSGDAGARVACGVIGWTKSGEP